MHRPETAVFLNQKGGVGKTTSVVNVGSGLTILGKRVLLVDLDPQGHLCGFLGIDPRQVRRTIYDVLIGDAPAREAVIQKELGARISMNGVDSRLKISVIPADLSFADSEVELSRLPDREYLLRDALADVRDNYDYILIDCPPSLGLLATIALCAAQKVFVPVQTEYLALESLTNLCRIVDSVKVSLNPPLEIGGLIATRFDGRKVLNRTIVERLREQFGALLLESLIRENIVLAEAPGFGKDIFTYRPRSHGAQDYLNLCFELMGRNTTADSLFTVERGGVISRLPDNVIAL
jgi:chromosome partitioning protein